jgi:hypothetical protein
MRIIKFILASLLCLASLSVYAKNSDSIRINKLEQSLQNEMRLRESLRSELSAQKTIIAEQTIIIDSLRTTINQNSQNIKSTADQLGVKINEANITVGKKADASEVETKTIWGGVAILFLLIIGGLTYYILHKRITKGSVDVEDLKQKAEKINEDILNKFTLEMVEMQKISSSLESLSKSLGTVGGDANQDHSLVKALADRITFMEMTLYKMDSSVRGYKQLHRSISQMKDNLLANGYELVDMLGKSFNDGMVAIVNYEDDENIEKGKRIITGIIKPQINYKGTMIQSAQITVSQNI